MALNLDTSVVAKQVYKMDLRVWVQSDQPPLTLNSGYRWWVYKLTQ